MKYFNKVICLLIEESKVKRMLVSNNVRIYNIPFDFLLEKYKIPKNELLYILIERRNIKFECDDNKNKIFLLNEDDLDHLSEISKIKGNMEKFDEINSSLLSFLLDCRNYKIKKKSLITFQEFKDYTEYLSKYWLAFYSRHLNDLLIDNYKKIIKDQEEKISQIENSNNYKEEYEELKKQVISLKMEIQNPKYNINGLWRKLKSFLGKFQ